MKKWLILLSLVLFVGVLSACGYTEEEITQRDAWIEAGCKKASYYIKTKYGSNLKITNATSETIDTGPIPDFSPDYTTNIIIQGELKGKEITVYVDAEDNVLNDCYDNFQQEEIVSDIEACVNDLYGKSPTRLEIEYYDWCGGREKDDNGMINALYDGDINSFLSEKRCDWIEVLAVYEDLDSLSDLETRLGVLNNTVFNAVNYKSGSNFSNSVGTDDIYFVNLLNRLPYIKDFYISQDTEEFKGYHKPDLKGYQDVFLYSNRVAETPEFDFTWNSSEIVDESNWESESCKIKRVSDVYRTPEYFVEIYYYLSQIRNYSSSKEYIICIKYVKDGEIKYSKSYHPTVVNNTFLNFNNLWGKYDSDGYWFIAERL